MKLHIALAATAAALLATTCAYGADTVYVAPAVVVPPAPSAPAPIEYDWSGFYIGGTAGAASGDVALTHAFDDWFNFGGTTDEFELEDTVYGAVGGYNFQFGHIVVGPEIAYSSGPSFDEALAPGFFFRSEISSIVSAKARIGAALNRVMIWGSVGYAWAEGSIDYDDTNFLHRFNQSADLSGLTYGVGLDLAVTDHIVVGVEYSAYDWNNVGFVGPDSAGTPTDLDGAFDSSSILGRILLKL